MADTDTPVNGLKVFGYMLLFILVLGVGYYGSIWLLDHGHRTLWLALCAMTLVLIAALTGWTRAKRKTK